MTRSVVILGFPGVQALDLVGPHDVFTGAAVLTEGGYQVRVVSQDGQPVSTATGLAFVAEAMPEPHDIDTLVIPGGAGVDAARDDPATMAWIAKAVARSRRVVSVCTGAFVAAQAGLLDGHRATTHWAFAGRLAREFPAVIVDPEPIFVRSTPTVWTAAGVTAGIDLALALVEEDYGTEVAQTVARWLVLYLRRPGGQTQFAAPVWMPRAKREPIREVQDAIESATRCRTQHHRARAPRRDEPAALHPGVHLRGGRGARRLRRTHPHRGRPPSARGDRRHRRHHRRPLRIRDGGNHAPQLHSPPRHLTRPVPQNVRLEEKT